MKQPRYTVVIPAFNAARTIGSAIRSVLQQTEQDFELIVVNDGSTDTTLERARSFASDARIQVISQPNRGPAAARNSALEVASGSYVSMLDSDDLWLPEYLQVMGKALDDHPEAPFAYTGAWVLDDETQRIRRRPALSDAPPPTDVDDARLFFLHLLKQNFVYGSTTARLSIFKALGGYDETLLTGEDWDLWLRIVRRGLLPVRVPRMLAIQRRRAGSLCSDTSTLIRNLCEIYRRFAQDADADEEIRELALRQLDYWERYSRRFEKQVFLVRARARAGALKHRALVRWLWLSRRPDSVERTLRAAGEIA